MGNIKKNKQIKIFSKLRRAINAFRRNDPLLEEGTTSRKQRIIEEIKRAIEEKSPNRFDKEYFPILARAVQYGTKKDIKKLLNLGAEPTISIKNKIYEGLDAIAIAIKTNNIGALELLTTKKNINNKLEYGLWKGWTYLGFALWSERINVKTVKALLKKNPDPFILCEGYRSIEVILERNVFIDEEEKERIKEVIKEYIEKNRAKVDKKTLYLYYTAKGDIKKIKEIEKSIELTEDIVKKAFVIAAMNEYNELVEYFMIEKGVMPVDIMYEGKPILKLIGSKEIKRMITDYYLNKELVPLIKANRAKNKNKQNKNPL